MILCLTRNAFANENRLHPIGRAYRVARYMWANGRITCGGGSMHSSIGRTLKLPPQPPTTRHTMFPSKRSNVMRIARLHPRETSAPNQIVRIGTQRQLERSTARKSSVAKGWRRSRWTSSSTKSPREAGPPSRTTSRPSCCRGLGSSCNRRDALAYHKSRVTLLYGFVG